jgi:hypothetical protein
MMATGLIPLSNITQARSLEFLAPAAVRLCFEPGGARLPRESGTILMRQSPAWSRAERPRYESAQAADGLPLNAASLEELSRAVQSPDSGCVQPAVIKLLKESRDVAVYLLGGAPPSGQGVIAIKCRRRRAVLESWIYQELLPRLSLPAPSFHGHVTEPSGNTHWIFLGEAGGDCYVAGNAAHRAAAARWLGKFHAACGDHAGDLHGSVLPRRDDDYFASELRGAIMDLRRHRSDPLLLRVLNKSDIDQIDALLGYCQIADARWHEVKRACGLAPLTIVHGDFADRNLRIGIRGDRDAAHVQRGSAAECLELIPFDWEDAAVGSPAIDLVQDDDERMYDAASPDLAIYLAQVAPHWPAVDEAAIRRLSEIGRLFWQILAISEDVRCMSPDWFEQPIEHFEIYITGFRQVLQSLGWTAGPGVPRQLWKKDNAAGN